MRSVLAIITTVFFALCQQYCLLAHGCQETASHEHANTDQADHHHAGPGHKHSNEKEAQRTAVPCCKTVKQTDTFSVSLDLPESDKSDALKSFFTLIALPPLEESTPFHVAQAPPTILARLHSSLIVSPNAPPSAAL